MDFNPQTWNVLRSGSSRPVVSKIAAKFQVTVPAEVRELFGLEEGDLLEWDFDAATSTLKLVPKRPQLISPRMREQVRQMRARRAKEPETVPMD